MDKISFIEHLRRSLASMNDYVFVNDTISYYENYIDSQIRMGKSEEEVMEELGDPRLIAKSILASHSEDDPSEETVRFFDEEQDAYEGKRKGPRMMFRFNNRNFNMPVWVAKLLGFILLGIIFFLLFTFLGWVVPFLLRIALIALPIYFLYRIIVRRDL